MTWFLFGVLALLAAAGFGLPWWWQRFTKESPASRRSANVAAYRSRLLELEAEADAHLLPDDALEEIRGEAAARLIEDAGDAPPPAVAPVSSLRLTAFLVLALTVFAVAWYALSGSWRTQSLVALSATDPAAARSASLDQMVERLEKYVDKTPGDAEAWAWLGRSYRTQGRKLRAVEALARANELNGAQDPDLLVEEGELLAQIEHGDHFDAALERFHRALEVSPDHPRGLWYAGLAALQTGNEATALRHWERLAQQDLPDTVRRNLEHGIAGLRQRTGAGTAAPVPTQAPLAIELEVSLAEQLAAVLRPDATLFVVARDAAAAGGPPLAVRRLAAGPFPLRVRLDDSHSMLPSHKLSGAQRWRLIARISRSGTAEPQAGDLEGELELGAAQAGSLQRLVIDRRRQ